MAFTANKKGSRKSQTETLLQLLRS